MNVDFVSYTPDDNGGTIELQMHMGSQQINTAWPKSEDDELVRLFDQMQVRVEQIIFQRTVKGREIEAHLSIGDRPLAVNWVLEEDDSGAEVRFDRLLQDARRSFVRRLESLMSDSASAESVAEAAPSENGRAMAAVDEGIW